MDREIKFREFVNGKFHYWGFTEEGIFKGPVTPSLTRGFHSQFTGLHDKNNTPIYEGDVLENSHKEKWEVEYGTEVITNCGCCNSVKVVGYDFSDFASPSECIIIGNIYENPELLNNG